MRSGSKRSDPPRGGSVLFNPGREWNPRKSAPRVRRGASIAHGPEAAPLEVPPSRAPACEGLIWL